MPPELKINHRTLQINGLDMHVLIAGEGAPLLLLHGFPDSAQLWRKMIPDLAAAGFQVIAPDQRGYGLTSAPAETNAYRIETIVADAIALLDALEVPTASVMGHDWGAVIGWALAAEHPERFNAYVAVSVGHPGAYMSASLEQKLKGWYVLMFQMRGIAEALFRAGNFRALRQTDGGIGEAEHWIADLSRPGRLTAALNWYRANFSGMLGARPQRVAIPVLGVWSTRDVALSEDQMTGSDRFIDGEFSYARVEGAGHWIPLERPGELAALAIPFLNSARTKGLDAG